MTESVSYKQMPGHIACRTYHKPDNERSDIPSLTSENHFSLRLQFPTLFPFSVSRSLSISLSVHVSPPHALPGSMLQCHPFSNIGRGSSQWKAECGRRDAMGGTTG